MCAGTSLSSRAICPKTDMRRAQWCETGRLHVDIKPTDRVRPADSYYLTLTDISRGRLLTLSCLLLEESKFLPHISTFRQNQSFINPQLSGERETLILSSHNGRSQFDTAFEILAAASTGRLQTSEIEKSQQIQCCCHRLR